MSAPSRDAAAAPSVNRRRFLCTIGAFGVSGAALSMLPACEVAELREGESGEFEFDLEDPKFATLRSTGGALAVQALGHPLLLVRVSEAELVALDRLCTHMQCDMSPDVAGRWDGAAQTLACLCHDSVFAKDGRVIAGPAVQSLRSFPVVLANGRGRVTL